jgi:hypothetical protein
MLSAAPFIAELPHDLAGRTTSLFTVHGRYGNNALNGDWELGITCNTSAPPQQQSQRTWGDGRGTRAEPFTFAITKIPASLTAPAATSGDFTIGGSNVKASYTDIASYEPNAIKIWARSTTTGSGLTIKDLKIKTPDVTGETVFPGTVINVSQDLGPVFQEIIIAGIDFKSMASGTVTLEGNVAMQFGNAPAPRGSSVQFHVIATHIPWVDLDVDSNNDGDIDLTNGRRGSDDPIEDRTDLPGMIVPVGGERAEMLVTLPAGRSATLGIDAAAADKVRVHKDKDRTQNTPLTFSPATANTPAKLDLSLLEPTSTTGTLNTWQLWVEALTPSTTAGDIAFTLTADTKGPPARDIVRATAVVVDLDVDSNNDGHHDPDDSSTGTDDPIENNPETAGVRLPAKGKRVEMRLTSRDLAQPTSSRLQIDSGAGNVELWDAPTGGTRLRLDAANGIRWAAGQRPEVVWIQAVRPSDEVGDIRFTLTESFGTSTTPITLSDTVRATAMAEVILFLHFDTQTALDELEDSLPPPTVIDQTGMLVLTPADSAALQARRAAWLAGHLGTPTVASTVKSFAELENAVTAAEGKLASARAAAAAMTNMRQQPSLHTSAQYLSAVESALYAHDEYLHAVQVAQQVQANFLADQTWVSSWDEALLRRFFALPVRIDGLEADITPEQWQGLTDSFDSVRASLGRLEDNLGRAAGGLRATRDVLAGGAIAVGAVYLLPVSVAVYAGGTILAGGAILSGAKRWNAGQSELEVVFGAAADTTGVTGFSLGLWGTDPVTRQQVALTPEDGTYELIVGASSISMLVGMPFANGLRGPTTSIPGPKPHLQFVESFSVVGDTLVASPVRFPTITWTKGAIEVSHQGVAIATAYAGTTRIVAMMASGPGPLLQAPADFDPQSLRGLTVDEVKSRIPSDWISETSSNGRGIRFVEPNNRGRQIRIDPTGYGAGVRPDPVVAGPYAVVSQNGRVVKVPLAGNPTL